MGTRSCIMVKIRETDKNQIKRFLPTLVPVTLEDWAQKDSRGRVWRDETGKERSREVTLCGNYIGIYCHWDGYLDCVGETLKEKFNNYDTALNLVVGGFCSSVTTDGVRRYANRGNKNTPYVNEKWDDIKPILGNTQVSVFENVDCEYCYLFDDEHGWRYMHFPNSRKSFAKY